ncbi:Cysteine-rich receptor-like protein kinase [Dorcoceras hygrometricum]|uniref:Cysteine-rich receptor-like protein kinase n=1 Tax=Dorcoceras hygrometricum TaxID=472368 RepID=A0A2Z7BZF0_9LAMI|nr:Cysteine-rich receptor-like protein kinase [Dorcoceras hygrometricum]
MSRIGIPGPMNLCSCYFKLMNPCVHDMVKWQHRGVRDPSLLHGAQKSHCQSAPGSDQFHEEIGTSTVGGFGILIRSTIGIPIPSLLCTRKLDEDFTDGVSSPERSERDFRRRRRRQQRAATAAAEKERRGKKNISRRAFGIQLAVGSQHLRLRNHIFGLTHRIMVKRLATSPHDPLGIIDSACKNQSVMVSVQYGPFNTNIPIRSTTIGKSRVARDPITMHTSWRSNSDIACVTSIGYPRTRASGESSTTKYRLHMLRDLTQSRHLMTLTESVNESK